MTMVRRFAPIVAMAALAGPAAAFSSSELVEYCPPVSIETAAKNIAVYPGGGEGRTPSAYSHIAVIISAAAVCREDENEQLVADVTIHYAVEPGPYYTGAAEQEVSAVVTRAGSAQGEAMKARRTVTPEFGGQPQIVSETISGLPVGEEAAVENGGLDIIVGFVKPR